MRTALDKPDFLYQATRVYLMLGGEGPLDRNLVRAWMRLDWERVYQGDSAAAIRDRLANHLDALLAEPLPRVALDGALVEAARVTFSRVPVANGSIRALFPPPRRSRWHHGGRRTRWARLGRSSLAAYPGRR